MLFDQNTLQQVSYQMIRGFFPFILLIVGTFGSFGNFITFTSKRLRKNSCAFYFLCTAIFELLTICFGLISRLAEQFGSTLQTQSQIYCKIRYYFALTFPTIATYLLLMAAIDRYMSASLNVQYRAFSQLNVAYRMVYFVIILSMLACSHVLIFVHNQPSCIPQSGIYSLFYSVYLISFCGVIPNTLLLIFGLCTIQNLKISRRRILLPIVISREQRHKQKIETQLVIMIVSQSIVSFIIDITRLSCYAYYLLTASRTKTPYQQTVTTFIFQFSIILSYFNYSESFYTNTLTSTLFRKVFRQTSQHYFRRLLQLIRKCYTQRQNGALIQTDKHINL